MNLWQKFFPAPKPSPNPSQDLSSIHQRLEQQLPQLSSEDHVCLACLAGLLARVAFVDLKITDQELDSMVEALKHHTPYPHEVALKVAHIAQEEIKELVDHEHHLYVRPLNTIYNAQQKAHVLQLLFQVAAADGRVENLESEEIRRIAKELQLSHQQFVQAKLTVREQIAALRTP